MRSLRIPAKAAARGLVPISMRLMPSVVRVRRIATTMHTAMNSRNGVATPNSLPLPTQFHASGKPTMAGPPVRTSASPIKTCPVPSVARIGVMRSLAINKPLTNPDTSPISTASNMPMMV